ncbi:tRNA lysidine(34) synthetase TilS [Dongia sp.]|uniref:tRNA lysidine(34) synthetase TilS n=1 Tax=Dongia sp. TaxID=1977262 RepID=UPI0035B0CAD1
MAACGPYESRPHIAVAVSGGADSLALMYLLHAWTRAQGGRLSAFTVDHGLRADSAAEADQVASWAVAAGIAHRILRWTGKKPESGLQAAARRARYQLLADACRAAGILHLVTAHQLDDQRETVAMRQARKGADQQGLAGMSAIVARDGVRLLRPLLGVSGEILRDYLRARGQSWLDDPSNQLVRFERVRWRMGLEGPLPAAAEIHDWGRQRVAGEEAIADLFIRSVEINPAGHVLIDLPVWRHAPERVRGPALARLIGVISGIDYPPASEALGRAVDCLLACRPAMSLGGCLIGTWHGLGLVCREASAVKDRLTQSGRWDNRFDVRMEGEPGSIVAILGEDGVAEIGQSGYFRSWRKDIPPLARPALPAVRDATGRLIFVAYLGFDPYGQGQATHFRFLPRNSATSSGFTVAYGWPHTI